MKIADPGGARFPAATVLDEPEDFARTFDAGRRAPAAPSGPNPPPPLHIIRPEEFLGVIIPPRQWIVPHWIPCGVVSGLYASGGDGKTLLSQQLQSAATIGGEWLGQMVEPVRSLGIYCEDEENELLRRQIRMSEHYRMDRQALAQMRLVSRVGMDNLLMTFSRGGSGELTPFHKQILERALDEKARLVIIDTAQDTFGGDENDRRQVRQFVGHALGLIAHKIDGAVLLCAHPSRYGERSGGADSGSTGWSNTMRSRLAFTRPETEPGETPQEDARLLSRKKANYASRNDEIRCRHCEGVFVVDQPKHRAGFSFCRPPVATVFLQILADFADQGRPVSISPNAANFAPRLFASHPNRQGYKQAEFRRAMEELFAEKKLHIEPYGRKGDERFKIVSVSL